MQFAVPQFTDVEDKLIGPLTLKQFLILLAAGGIVMFFYSLLNFSIFFWFFAIPFGMAGIGFAFGKFNGRPMYMYFGVFGSFLSVAKVRIFRREEPVAFVKKAKTEVTSAKSQLEKKPPTEEAASRLKKLAYLLDQKAHEEEELISRS